MSVFYTQGKPTTYASTDMIREALEESKIDMGLVDVVAGDPARKAPASAQKPNILRRGTRA